MPGDGGGKRLMEILAVLHRHGVEKGLTPEKLRLILEDLGPTFIKLGQIMSMRPDMLPKDYCDALTGLRTEVAPMPPDEVRAVIEESCGRPMEAIFSGFTETPIGAASIAQAHLATLQTGERVVVKVQRRNIYGRVEQDIRLMKRASGLIKLAAGTGDVIDFPMVLDEMWKTMREEMDFLREADNAEAFAGNNSGVAYVTCPKIYRAYTTDKVLIMEYIGGRAINDKEGLLADGYDLTEIGAKLADNYLKQIIDDGLFHADPHPGNIRVRDGKIVWIDLGMMGRLSRKDQRIIAGAMKAVACHDTGGVVNAVTQLGVCKRRIDTARLYEDVDGLLTRYAEMDVGDMNMAVIMTEAMDVAAAHSISMPSGVSMLGRGIGTIEGVMADISPEINFTAVCAGRYSSRTLSGADLKKELLDGGGKLFQSGRKAVEIPALLADALRQGVKGQVRVRNELKAGEELRADVTMLLNRLILGLAAAALSLGGCLVLAAGTGPLLGALSLPGLVLLALAGGILLGLLRKKRR